MDGDVFISQIIERCENLIKTGIWEGLDIIRLQIWMKNFETPNERYFAACVLDALIYRSEAQTIAMMKQLFQRIIPDLLRQDTLQQSDSDWYLALKKSKNEGDPYIRIVPVIQKTDSPATSSPPICRLYRRGVGLNQDWMIWPQDIGKARDCGANKFLFVDDFLGTGTQFSKFATQFHLEKKLKDVYAIYAPLVAHEKGIVKLRGILPELRVCAVEMLDDKYNLFSKKSMWFRDQTNTPERARTFYDALLRKKRLYIKKSRMIGYGQLAIAYAFAHAIPNNCLPLLWLKRNWNPLFER